MRRAHRRVLVGRRVLEGGPRPRRRRRERPRQDLPHARGRRARRPHRRRRHREASSGLSGTPRCGSWPRPRARTPSSSPLGRPRPRRQGRQSTPPSGTSARSVSAASYVILVGSVGFHARARPAPRCGLVFHVARADDLPPLRWDRSPPSPPAAPQGLTTPRTRAEVEIAPRRPTIRTGPWSPGIRSGVEPGSEYHHRVLRPDPRHHARRHPRRGDRGAERHGGRPHAGLYPRPGRDQPVAQRDPGGNVYATTGWITGAIVQRQPFGTALGRRRGRRRAVRTTLRIRAFTLASSCRRSAEPSHSSAARRVAHSSRRRGCAQVDAAIASTAPPLPSSTPSTTLPVPAERNLCATSRSR